MEWKEICFILPICSYLIGIVRGGAIYTVEVVAEGGVKFTHKDPLFNVNGFPVEGAPKGRGYNIVTINSKSGKVLEKKRFDTCGSASHAANMVSFIASIPDNSLVLLGNWDESSGKCAGVCYQALQTIGSNLTTLGRRDTHALIGYKGPPPFPSWVQEAHAAYPGENSPNSAVLTLRATIRNFDFSGIESVANTGKIHATLMTESSAHNARHCGLLCSQTPKCMSFTFCEKQALCSLYTGLKTKTFSTSGCRAFAI